MDKDSKFLVSVVVMNGLIWATTGAVAVTAVKRTGNGRWGYLMLIPAFFSFSYQTEHSNKIKSDS